MSRKRLTLYIPCYKAEAFLPALFASLDPLPPERVELIFVDDSSPDNGAKLIEDFCAGRTNARLVRHAKNSGVAAASDTGIAAATGDYIQRCDADDEVMADGLLAALNLAETSHAAVVLQGFIDKRDSREDLVTRQLPAGSRDMLDALWKGMVPAIWATMVRADLAKRPGLEFARLSLGEDFHWLARALEPVATSAAIVSAAPSYRYFRRPGSAAMPLPEGLGKHAQKVLDLIDVLLPLGMAWAREGRISRDDVDAMMRNKAREALRALRKSGQAARTLAEYRRLKALVGASEQMRHEYRRALPAGVWRYLWT